MQLKAIGPRKGKTTFIIGVGLLFGAVIIGWILQSIFRSNVLSTTYIAPYSLVAFLFGILVAVPIMILGFIDWRRNIWLLKYPMSCKCCGYSGQGKIQNKATPQLTALFLLLGLLPAFLYSKAKREIVCPNCGDTISLKGYVKSIKGKS
jgi:hypothetical protein